MNIVRTLITNKDWDSTGSYTGLNGKHVFGVASFIDTMNWGVISEIPGKRITGPIYRTLLAVAGIILFIALLSGGIGLLFVNRLLKPFALISNAISRVSGGDYTTKLTPSPVKEIDNIVDGFNRMTQEINQREHEVRNGEEKFRSLVENTTDWIWEVDEQARYTYSSPQIRELLGYEPDETIGITPFDLMTPEDQQRVRTRFVEIAGRQEPFFRLENANLHKDGHTVILETSGVPIFGSDGSFKGYRGIDRDVTERKLFDEKIASFANILEESLNEIYIFDAKTFKFIQVNKGAKLNLGYSMEEISNLTPLDLKPEFTAESFAKMVEPLLKDEKQKIQFETVHRRKDGSLYDVEVHLQRLYFSVNPCLCSYYS